MNKKQIGGYDKTIPIYKEPKTSPFVSNINREIKTERFREFKKKYPDADKTDKNQLVNLQVYEPAKPPRKKRPDPALFMPMPTSYPYYPPQYNYQGYNPAAPYMYKPNQVPIIKNYEINASGPLLDHARISQIYEDILPPNQFKNTFNTLGERLNIYNFVRSVFILTEDGEDIDIEGKSLRSLLGYLKFLDLNPYDTGYWTNNPYKTLPKNMLIYKSCYPIRYDKSNNQTECASNSVGMNVRIYRLSNKEYNVRTVQNNKLFDYDIWRELRYYEHVKEHILKKNVCPHFPLMYAYYICQNCNIEFDKIEKIKNKGFQSHTAQRYNRYGRNVSSGGFNPLWPTDRMAEYISPTLLAFDGENGGIVLSNSYNFEITFSGENFKTAWAAYYASLFDKTKKYDNNYNVTIWQHFQNAPDADIAHDIYKKKKMDAIINNFRDKKKNMKKILKIKFGGGLKERLMKNPQTYIVYHSNSKGIEDIQKWGDNLDNNRGGNELGKLLMEIRKEFGYNGPQKFPTNEYDSQIRGKLFRDIVNYPDNINQKGGGLPQKKGGGLPQKKGGGLSQKKGGGLSQPITLNTAFSSRDPNLSKINTVNQLLGTIQTQHVRNSGNYLNSKNVGATIAPNPNAYSGKALVSLSEAPNYNLIQWASKRYEIMGNVRKMTNTGFYDSDIWKSVLFQILCGFRVLQINKIRFHNFTAEDNIYIKDSRAHRNSNSHWVYVIDGIKYYIPNYGYVVLFDSNFKDLKKNNSILNRRTGPTQDHKIYFKEDSISDENLLEDLEKSLQTNIFSKNFTNNGGTLPPDDIMELIKKINDKCKRMLRSGGTNPNKYNITHLISNCMSFFLHNRVGTLLKRYEQQNVNININKDFKRGDIICHKEVGDSYKFVLYLEKDTVNSQNSNVLTRDRNNIIVENSIPDSDLFPYPSSYKIRQDYHPDKFNFIEEKLLETYVVN